MSIRAALCVLACSLAAGSAGALGACSSGSSNGGGGGDDSGAGADGTTGGDGSGSSGSSSGGGPGDAGGGHDVVVPVDCGGPPQIVRDDAGTTHCTSGTDGGLSCGVGQQCCLAGKLAGGQSAPTECAEFNGVCLNGGDGGGGSVPAIAIQCWTAAACAANGVPAPAACCLKGAPPPAAACSFPFYASGTAVVCEGPGYGVDGGDAGGAAADAGDAGTGCRPGEPQLCETKADCPAAKTCVPGRWMGYDIGFCE